MISKLSSIWYTDVQQHQQQGFKTLVCPSIDTTAGAATEGLGVLALVVHAVATCPSSWVFASIRLITLAVLRILTV